MFGDTWDESYVKMSDGRCVCDGVCFWRRIMDLKSVDKYTRINYLCGIGVVRNSRARR